MDQRTFAEAAGLSVPTMQRMEASEGVIRGNVDARLELAGALDAAGNELTNEGAAGQDGERGVRPKTWNR